jgi:pyruvate dehydrogenase E2 component (dihydrolipoamide acetyltransferase)
LAAEAGIPLSALSAQGTGPGGRVVAADVRDLQARGGVAAVAAQAAGAEAAAAGAAGGRAGGFRDIPHSQMRRVIAHRLTASKQSVPHYYLTSDITLDTLLAVRASLNAELPADAKLSVNDFLIKAAALGAGGELVVVRPRRARV